MTPVERDLFTRLLGALAERFSDSGHLFMLTVRESRGHCQSRAGCGSRCLDYQRLLIEASEMLEQEMAEPVQVGLFDEAAG